MSKKFLRLVFLTLSLIILLNLDFTDAKSNINLHFRNCFIEKVKKGKRNSNSTSSAPEKSSSKRPTGTSPVLLY